MIIEKGWIYELRRFAPGLRTRSEHGDHARQRAGCLRTVSAERWRRGERRGEVDEPDQERAEVHERADGDVEGLQSAEYVVCQFSSSVRLDGKLMGMRRETHQDAEAR